MDRTRALRGAAIAIFLVLAVRRFVPSVPLALIAHEPAPVPAGREDPAQEPLAEIPAIERPDGIPVELTPRARFDASGQVVSAERYRFDGGAFAIPYDVAIRWGELLEEPYRSQVEYYQNGRFCLWRTDMMSFDRNLITAHMANIHVIPAARAVRRALAHVRPGQFVRLEGILVDVDGVGRKEGFQWRTSLSRTDSDQGACETIYLEALTIGARRYR